MTHENPPSPHEDHNEELPITPEVQETIANLEDFTAVYTAPEKVVLDEKTQQEIEDIKAEIEFRQSPTNEAIRDAQNNQTPGDEKLHEAPTKKPWLKRAGLALAFTAASIFGGGKKAEAHTTDSAKNKIESVSTNNEDSLRTNKNTIKVYAGAKTKEGATTPTGLNNSFLNNEYNIHEGDVESVAKKFGFRTNNVEDFQVDMFGYLEKNYPEDMKNLVKKYGLPAAGKMTDAILGVRVAFALDILKHKIPGTPEIQKEVNPYASFSKTWEPLYDPNSHISAEMHYYNHKSTSIKDAGMLDTGEEDVLLIFRGDAAPGTNAPSIIIKKEDLGALTGGTKYFQSQEKLDELREQAIALSKKEKTNTGNTTDLAKGNTQ